MPLKYSFGGMVHPQQDYHYSITSLRCATMSLVACTLCIPLLSPPYLRWRNTWYVCVWYETTLTKNFIVDWLSWTTTAGPRSNPWLICMCLVRDDVDSPFSNYFIVDWLSWTTTAGPRSNPWLIRRLWAQMTSDKPSETPMISASHEDFATSVCFVLDM